MDSVPTQMPDRTKAEQKKYGERDIHHPKSKYHTTTGFDTFQDILLHGLFTGVQRLSDLAPAQGISHLLHHSSYVW